MKAHNARPLWITLFWTAAFIRLGFVILTGRLWHPELWEYESIAKNILQGTGFVFKHFGTSYRSYCEPLYPYFVAAVYFISRHSQPALVLAQIFLSALTVVFAGKSALLLTKSMTIAWAAGLLMSIHPGLVIYSAKQHPLNLDALFFTLVIWSAFAYADHPTRPRILLMGILTGLGILTRPTIILLVPLVAWWTYRFTKTQNRETCIRIVLALGATAGILCPWIIRNYAVHGQFMLTRSNTPFVFWLGNNPNATGSALNQENVDILSLAPKEFSDRIYETDEIGQNRVFGEAALAYVRSNPLGFLLRTAKKFFYFWWFSPQAGLRYSTEWMKWYKLWWTLLAIAGLQGFLAAKHLIPELRIRVWLIVIMATIISLSQSLFYIEGRHRLALEPMLSPIMAMGVVHLLAGIRAGIAGLGARKMSPEQSNE